MFRFVVFFLFLLSASQTWGMSVAQHHCDAENVVFDVDTYVYDTPLNLHTSDDQYIKPKAQDIIKGHFLALVGDFIATKSVGKVDPNKLNHIFGQQKHELGPLLDKFGGSQEKAFRALDDVAQNALKSGKLNLKNGINTQTRVNVNGVDVDLIGGRVVNGRFHIGSASRRDIP